jgi:hypothetical protein
MIKIELIAAHVFKIVAPETLKSDDFAALAATVDPLLATQGKIRLLIDASHLEGWDNLQALERHAGFVKTHQNKVEKVAVIVRHDWQHWLVGAVRVFVHPEIKAFGPGDAEAAQLWLMR